MGWGNAVDWVVVFFGREETRCWRGDWGRGGEESVWEGIGGGKESIRWCRQHDGEELAEVEVTLIAVIEGNAPDDFVFSGDVMVLDHAVVQLSTELHPDVASDEAMRRQGRVRHWEKNGDERRRDTRCFGRGCLGENVWEKRRNGEWERDTRCCRRGC